VQTNADDLEHDKRCALQADDASMLLRAGSDLRTSCGARTEREVRRAWTLLPHTVKSVALSLSNVETMPRHRRYLAFCLVNLLASIAHAQGADSQRWVRIDGVPVHSLPTSDGKAVGSLPRGAEVTWSNNLQEKGFCRVYGEGQDGYVPCEALSSQPVARVRAGVDGIDPLQRWVTGNGVTVRDAPRPDGAVRDRLSLNAVVRLKAPASDSAYCEIALAAGDRGFTACRYLADTPVVLTKIFSVLDDGSASKDYDPERAFQLKPSWITLAQYARYLAKRRSAEAKWPYDALLERMKAHLAQGTYGGHPLPMVDWASLKSKADSYAATMPLNGVQSSPDSTQLLHELVSDLRLGKLEELGGRADSIVRLIKLLDFGSVAPSLFQSEAQVAPPHSTAEGASGRFGIIFRQVVAPRLTKNDSGDYGTGLYDMQSVSRALVKPISQVHLFKDGKVTRQPSYLRAKEYFWTDVDKPMCNGWYGGFQYGDADKAIWRFDSSLDRKSNPNPDGSIMLFYTNLDLPELPAKLTVRTEKLNRNTTAFVSGIYRFFDLDGDGVPDVVVWEAKGHGPGYLSLPTTTDDSWYRLALVNINGAWKVLAVDGFGYGCGC
jgi:hypothetical protein